MVELPRDHPHVVCWGWRQLRWSCKDHPTKQSNSSVTREFSHSQKTKELFFKFRLSEILFIRCTLCFYVVEPKRATINNLYNLPPLSASGDRQGNQSRSAKSSFGTTEDAEEETPLGPMTMGGQIWVYCVVSGFSFQWLFTWLIDIKWCTCFM